MVEAVRFDIVIVFFIYGLAFFSMGMLLPIEARRSPSLFNVRLLWPLAFFGVIHGIHEWLEMSLEVRSWFGLESPAWLSWLRLGVLVTSFSFLLFFGLQFLYLQKKWHTRRALGIGVSLFGLYVLLILATFLSTNRAPAHWLEHADVFVRYVLAVPAAALAAYVLNWQGRQMGSESHKSLGVSLRLAAACFALYCLTQFVVSPLDVFPAHYINTTTFLNLAGFPIQLVRAVLAVGITVSLIRSIQIMEDERQRQFTAAQQGRLEALERVQRDLVEREALRRELLRHTVITQEEERARIARELHDETAQFLTALSLNLATLRKSLPDVPNLREMLDRLQSLSAQMSRGIYRMVHDLRPAQLDDLGLVAALYYLAEEEQKRTGLSVSLEIDAPQARLDPLIETVLFRVAQEALTNVARHAECDRAAVRLLSNQEAVILQVEDSGAGFAPEKSIIPPHGFGLAGMRERAESVGGQLNIQSSPGQGTLVEVKVPLLVRQSTALEEAAHEYHPLDIG